MLVRFFRINDPYRLLAILVLMVIISLPLFIDPVLPMLHELKSMVLGETLKSGVRLYSLLLTETAPMAVWFSNWMEALLGRSETGWRILALLILFFQMSFFTIILINNKAHIENTYLPGLIFGLLALFSFDMLSFSNELMASTMMLFALNSLFKEIEFRIQRDSIVHSIGFFVGLASLFVFNYIIFLPGVLILLAIFTRLNVRKSLLLIFGFALPHLLIMSVYLLRGDFQMLISNYYFNGFSSEQHLSFSTASLITLCAAPAVFFLLSLVMLNREARLTKYQSQLMQVMFLWIILSAITIFFSRSVQPHHFILFIPPLSYFISHYILLIRRKRLAELTIWAFVITLVSVLYLTRYQVSKVDYDKLFPSSTRYSNIAGKQVLPLCEDWGLLQNNELATGFYDWKVSQPVFTNLDVFENVMLVDKAFQVSSPEVIIDPQNLMDGVMQRIPELRNKYRREEDLYLRVTQ